MKTFSMTRRAAVSGWLVIWAGAVLWATISSLPYNPLSPGLDAERRTRLVLPEGWGFFSRDPRERDLIVARRLNGRWQLDPPHADASNLFGLSRITRVIPIEASQILSELAQPLVPCSVALDACLEAAPVHTVASDPRRPFLCGEVALLRRAPVPWAWHALLRPDQMPTDVLRMNVRCDHE